MDASQQISQPLDLQDTIYNDSSQGKRFLGYIIDTVVVLGIYFLLLIVMGSGALLDGDDTLNSYLLSYSLTIIYYWLMESTLQKTVGKMILGMHIIKDDGSRPTSLNVLGRTFARLIPFDAFALLFGDRAWHDTIPSIRVVDNK